MVKKIYGVDFYYPDGLDTYLEQLKELKEFLQRGLDFFDEETGIIISPSYVLDGLVEKMKHYVNYVSVVSNSEDNVYFENSRPLEKMRKITQSLIDFRYESNEEQNAIRNKQLQHLRKVADSSVTGLDFGIISNSIVSHLIYSEMNEAKKKEQQKDADKWYNNESHNIYSQNFDAVASKVGNYEREFYLPVLRQAFQEFYIETFNKCMRILDRIGSIDLNEINKTDYDIDASNSCLKSAYSITKETIFKALSLCPYNPNVYKVAYENKLFSTELLSLSITFDVYICDSEVNYVETEKIHNALSKKWISSLYIIPLLENSEIHISPEIVAVINNLKKEDKENIKEDIINHFKLEKKKNNSSTLSLTNETIKFINRTKSLLSLDDELYQEIIDKVFAIEINDCYKSFDILLKLSKSPEYLSTYAKTNREIIITDMEISRFLKYYEIISNKKLQTIVSLIGDAKIENFKEYITELNKKISVEYQKHQQAEKEKRAREEQLAKELREREEQNKREVEEKKRLIREEIQSLNSELESLGFALFGQKARRKAELKSLIAKKQAELNNVK